MPHSCSIKTCYFKYIAKCPCCNENLCRRHFLQHDFLLRSKFHCFNEQIGEFTEQLQRIDLEKITNEFILQLNQWRLNSYRMIDEFYQNKYNELYNHIHQIFIQQDDNLIQLRSKFAQIINQQKSTEKDLKILTMSIQNFQYQINQIKHISIQFHINPLVISNDLINIHLLKPHLLHVTQFISPYQKIPRLPFTSDVLASNDQYLLMHQNSNLYFINEHLFVINQNRWPHGWIRDMSWSQTLKAFFLLTSDQIYLVTENTLQIEHLKSLEDRSWQCCTCSDTCFYLTKDSCNSTINQYSLKPSIKFIKHYQRLETNDEKQRIDSMKYHNQMLALVINDQLKKEIFLELRSMPTFDRLWTCQLSMEYTGRKMHCCYLAYQGWIVMDVESSFFFHINEEDGNVVDVIKSKDKTHYINFFGIRTMVIVNDESVNFYRLDVSQ